MPNEWRAQMELRAANQIIGREKRLYPNKRLKISGCGSSTARNRELRTERSFDEVTIAKRYAEGAATLPKESFGPPA